MVRLEGGLWVSEFRNRPFQFLYGAIGSTGPIIETTASLYFNSYMVRLEEGEKKEAIEAKINFNSYMVRLEEFAKLGILSFSRISIPIWCDWKINRYRNRSCNI